MDCNCRNELNLDKLCAKKIKACKMCVKDINIDNTFCARDVSSPKICAGSLITDKLDANRACIKSLNVTDECVQNLTATNMGVVNLVANNLCVPGELKANVKICSKYEATAVYSSNTTYTLGGLLNFNNILSNASGALSTTPTAYKAPVAGNYIVMFQIDQQNLIPDPAFGPILGVPVANPQIILNGVIHRELYSSYLTFFNQQRSTMTALVRMNANDIMNFKYKVLAVQQATGVTEVVGTVDILGNGSADDQSIVKIELISVECDNGGTTPCAPVTPCAPCVPEQCTPCVANNSGDCDLSFCHSSSLRAPILNPITLNPGSLNSYMISWNSVNDANNYTLEVSNSFSFTNPIIIASGNILSFAVNNQLAGTYYYRVFASNNTGNSPYSNIQSIVIV